MNIGARILDLRVFLSFVPNYPKTSITAPHP